MRFVFGIIIMFHGLVHLLYSAHSAKYFELTPGMVWPDGSWAFSRLLGNEVTRNLASLSLILAAIGLFVSGAGILVNQAWWQPVIVGTTVFSSVIYILLWNGRIENLDSQGVAGILINMAILFATYITSHNFSG